MASGYLLHLDIPLRQKPFQIASVQRRCSAGTRRSFTNAPEFFLRQKLFHIADGECAEMENARGEGGFHFP